MEMKTTPNPIEAAGPAKRVLSNLFYGWGYNFYRRENQLRADDLLIRGKLSELLGECRAHLGSVEAAFRHEHLPPPTREHPFPDPAAVAAVQALQHRQRDIEALETAIRNAPVPEMDRIYQRHRTERDTLEKLVAVDGDLVSAVVALRDAVIRLDGAAAAAQDTGPAGTSDIQMLWNRREQILSALEESP
jgi:hypothetical protein